MNNKKAGAQNSNSLESPLPAKGGAIPFGPMSSVEQPNSSGDRKVTIEFKGTATIRGGAILLGGPKLSGANSGKADGDDLVIELEDSATMLGAQNLSGGSDGGGKGIAGGDDLVIELEGRATMLGAQNLLGGSDGGGKGIAGGDTTGEGATQRPAVVSQKSTAYAQGGDHAKGS